MEPLFLTTQQVILIQEDQISLYGGSVGVRDHGLLESAVLTPSQTMFGQFLHRDLFEMGAAYAFHICQNHPFHDGNKRTATASALLFLKQNGIEVDVSRMDLETHILGFTAGTHTKSDLGDFFRGAPLPPRED